jgi:protein SCO1/2
MLRLAPRKFGMTIAAVALAAALAGAWLALTYREHDSRAMLLPDGVVTVFPDPTPLTAFTLIDHHQRPFGLESLKGKWSFLFFGFTNCPDVCPTTLATLARVREDLAKNAVAAESVQFIFVSVDPHRDSVDKLEQYATSFHASFLGVTGLDAQLRNLADQLGAAYQRPSPTGSENHPVIHSTAVFLLDPLARRYAVFTPPLDAKAIGARFKVLRELGS